jgi:hypothetical protein
MHEKIEQFQLFELLAYVAGVRHSAGAEQFRAALSA